MLMHCEHCGKPLTEGNMFCEHCGARAAQPVTSTPYPPAAPAPFAPSAPIPQAQKSNKKTVVVLSIVCVLLVAALVTLFCVFVLPGMMGQNNPDDGVAPGSWATGVTTLQTQDVGNVALTTTIVRTTGTTTTTTATTTTTTTKANLDPVQAHDVSYEVIADGIIVREGASSEAAPVLTGLKKGYTFTSGAKQGDWVYADFGAVKGWVHVSGIKAIDRLSDSPAIGATPIERQGRVKTRDGDGVNLRRGPSTSHDIIQPILENQVMYVISWQNDWYYVEYAGMNGWVSDEFVVLL